MAGDIHGHRKTLRRTVGDPSLNICLWREGDGVEQEVELAPPSGDLIEQGIHLIRPAYVERQYYVCLHRLRQRLHMGQRPVVKIGER